MSEAVVNRESRRNCGIVAAALFPPIHIRFAVALLLTFFPLGFLYPLNYPAGELLTLCCWTWVFPSPIGWLSLGLLPLMPVGAYSYFAFNLFCLVATLAIAGSAFRSKEFQLKKLAGLHKFARGCMAVTLVIAAVQSVTDPYMWMSIFSNLRLEARRGAGLKSEPSQLASLLALYLVLLVGRIECARRMREPHRAQGALLREGLWAILLTVALTRSLTVLIVALCFLPVLFIRRKHLLPAFIGLIAGGVVAISVLGGRISDALQTSGGSMTDLITESVGSWRNIPDILILSNMRDFLLVGNPSEVRAKITVCAVRMSPALIWIQNTFSTFSAGGVTIGVLATAAVFIAGIAIGRRSLASSTSILISWLMLYLAAWFVLAKWDPSVWVALGLLPLMHKLIACEPERCFLPFSRKLEQAALEKECGSDSVLR